MAELLLTGVRGMEIASNPYHVLTLIYPERWRAFWSPSAPAAQTSSRAS